MTITPPRGIDTTEGDWGTHGSCSWAWFINGNNRWPDRRHRNLWTCDYCRQVLVRLVVAHLREVWEQEGLTQVFVGEVTADQVATVSEWLRVRGARRVIFPITWGLHEFNLLLAAEPVRPRGKDPLPGDVREVEEVLEMLYRTLPQSCLAAPGWGKTWQPEGMSGLGDKKDKKKGDWGTAAPRSGPFVLGRGFSHAQVDQAIAVAEQQVVEIYGRAINWRVTDPYPGGLDKGRWHGMVKAVLGSSPTDNQVSRKTSQNQSDATAEALPDQAAAALVSALDPHVPTPRSVTLETEVVADAGA